MSNNQGPGWVATNPYSEPGSLWVWFPGQGWVKYLSSNGQQVTASWTGTTYQFSPNAVLGAADPTGQFEAMPPAARIWNVQTGQNYSGTTYGTTTAGNSVVLAQAPAAMVAPSSNNFGPGMTGSNGMGSGSSIGTSQLAALMMQMQTNQQFATLLANGASNVNGASAYADAKIPLVEMGEAVLAVLSQQGTNAAASLAGSSAAGLLITVLGSNVVTSLVNATVDFNSEVTAAASEAAAATAWNDYVTAINTTLSTVSNNSLMATVAAGGTTNTASLLSAFMSMQANSTFVTANGGTSSSSLATLKTATSAFSTAFAAWLNSQVTYALIASATLS